MLFRWANIQTLGLSTEEVQVGGFVSGLVSPVRLK